jgi:hypothetical protein
MSVVIINQGGVGIKGDKVQQNLGDSLILCEVSIET